MVSVFGKVIGEVFFHSGPTFGRFSIYWNGVIAFLLKLYTRSLSLVAELRNKLAMMAVLS